MQKRITTLLAVLLLVSMALTACGGQATPQTVVETVVVTQEVEVSAPAEADLQAIKDYLILHGDQMQAETAALEADAEEYFALAEAADFDYEALWADQSEEVSALLLNARQQWILAHNDYELVEGIVAGVPSLAFYDTWIDAGPPCAEEPEECVEWTLELDDGRVFESPGNIFHHMLETTMWGTVPEHTGLAVDLDGDGAIDVGEAIPEAYMFLGAARAMDEATAEMNEAIDAWEPTMEDSFTALLAMIPTMGEYFEEWKLSSFIIGEDPRFVAQTRLVDIKGIATSLDVIYSHVGPAVAVEDPAMDEQISSGFDDLLDFLDQVYTDEQVGVQFTPEEADSLGTEAQDKAQALAALVAQAAAKLGLELEV